MKLYQHQQEILDRNPSKHLIAFGTGTGKTVTSIALAHKNNASCLIVVPKALKLNWERNIEQYCTEMQYSFEYQIVSKEELRRDWNEINAFSALILDEMHYFGNLKSQMSKSLQKYIRKHNPTYIWGLTATPYCSSPMNIFALATHLGYKWPYWSFYNKFYMQVQMGARTVPVLRKGIENDVAQLVKSIGTTCTMEECFDVPEQTFENIYFDLTPSQKKGIKDIDEPVSITRWTKTHQIANGIKIGDEYIESEYFECLKNDYIVLFSEENPKFAVICRYNLQIDRLKELLIEAGKKVFIISGREKNRDAVVQEVERTDECVVLIQADCAIGFEIPSVPIMLFASMSFSFSNYTQSIGRILRANKLKKNLYQFLLVKGTIDEDVYKCIMNKQDFNEAIYAREKM